MLRCRRVTCCNVGHLRDLHECKDPLDSPQRSGTSDKLTLAGTNAPPRQNRPRQSIRLRTDVDAVDSDASFSAARK
jgi:hypothetical protein